MRRCWAEQPADRPTFSELKKFLGLVLCPKDTIDESRLDNKGLYSSSLKCFTGNGIIAVGTYHSLWLSPLTVWKVETTYRHTQI